MLVEFGIVIVSLIMALITVAVITTLHILWGNDMVEAIKDCKTEDVFSIILYTILIIIVWAFVLV